MARTSLTRITDIDRIKSNKAAGDRIITKLAEHDAALDALEAGTTSTVVTIHPVRSASTANVASLASFTVSNDGVTCVAGDRVLLKDQSTPAQNGIYVVGTVAAGSAPLTRATDFDASAEVKPNTIVAVAAGTANANTYWQLAVTAAPTIGSTSLTFVQIFTATELASTASGKGASVIGLQDASGLVSSANVEGAISTDIAKGNGLLAMAPVRRVRAVTTSNLAAFTGISESFDGLTLVEGDRILVAAQSTAAENGIYVVGAVDGGTADWSRAADMAASAVVPNSTIIVVDAGTTGANRVYKLTNAGAITIGTTGLTFDRIYTATEATAAGITIAKRTVTVDESDLSTASQAVNIGAALPTNAIVLAHEIVVNENAAGQSDLTITIGGTDADAIVASTDLDALSTDPGKYQGTLGTHPRGTFSEEQLVATFAATDLGNLTTGNWTITVWYSVLA